MIEKFNRYILIRYDVCANRIVEGFWGTVEEAKKYADKTFPESAISIYELAGNCEDLAE